MSDGIFNVDFGIEVPNPANKAQETPPSDPPKVEEPPKVEDPPVDDPSKGKVEEPPNPNPEDNPPIVDDPPPASTEPPKPGSKEDEDEEEEEVTPAQFMYNYMVQNKQIAEVKDFDGSDKALQGILTNLPQTYFNQAITSMHKDSQELMSYAYNLGQEGGVEKLKDYFDKYVAPKQTSYNIEEEDGAKAYLKEYFTKKEIYPTAEDVEAAVQMIEDKGKSIEYAKGYKQKDDIEIEKLAKAERDRVEVENQQKLDDLKQWYNKIDTQLTELKWSESRTQAVFNNLDRKELKRKNDLIRQSPMAVIQLADIYSYFDEKTGQFDFTNLIETKAQSKVNQNNKKKIEKDAFSSSLSTISGAGKPKKKKADVNNSGGTIKLKLDPSVQLD